MDEHIINPAHVRHLREEEGRSKARLAKTSHCPTTLQSHVNVHDDTHTMQGKLIVWVAREEGWGRGKRNTRPSKSLHWIVTRRAGCVSFFASFRVRLFSCSFLLGEIFSDFRRTFVIVCAFFLSRYH